MSVEGVRAAEGDENKLSTIETRKRDDAVKELLILLLRATESVRAYSLSHPAVRNAVGRALERLKTALQTWGTLELDIAPTQVLVDGKPIVIAPSGLKRADLLSQPLFAEGIRRLSVLPQGPDDEYRALLEAWLSAAASQASDGISTRIWEMELKFVRLVILDSFEASADATGDGSGILSGDVGALGTTGSTRGASFKAELDALISAMSETGQSNASLEEYAGATISVSADDVALLRQSGIRNISQAELAQQDVNHLATQEVDDSELRAIGQAIEKERAEVVERFASSLANAAVLAAATEREALVERFGKLAESLAVDGRFNTVLQCFEGLVQTAKGDTLLGPLRVEVLKRFKASLTTDSMVQLLVRGLDTEGTAEESFHALKVMSKAIAGKIEPLLPRIQSPEYRKKVAGLLGAPETASAHALAAQMKVLDTTGVSSLLDRLSAFKMEEGLEIVIRALSSPNVEVRRMVVDRITPAMGSRLSRPLVAQRLNDTDPFVRQCMIQLVAETEDPSSVTPLLSLLRRSGIELAERKLIYRALGIIGGTQAEGGMLEELNRQSDVDVRVACIEGLAAFRSIHVRAALDALASKLLTHPKLKKAAKDVLAGKVAPPTSGGGPS